MRLEAFALGTRAARTQLRMFYMQFSYTWARIYANVWGWCSALPFDFVDVALE